MRSRLTESAIVSMCQWELREMLLHSGTHLQHAAEAVRPRRDPHCPHLSFTDIRLRQGMVVGMSRRAEISCPARLSLRAGRMERSPKTPSPEWVTVCLPLGEGEDSWDRIFLSHRCRDPVEWSLKMEKEWVSPVCWGVKIRTGRNLTGTLGPCF